VKRVRVTLLLGLALLAAAPAAFADPRDSVGGGALAARLGTQRPSGRGVPVALVEGLVTEADGRPAFRPDTDLAEFAGVRFTSPTAAPPGAVSPHATAVARYLAGRTTSLAPGIPAVAMYSAPDWLGTGFLQSGPAGAGLAPLAVAARVANHSWVGDSPAAADILRRVDWVVHRDEFVQVVGVNNEGPVPQLLAGAFNAIAVGRTAGSVTGTAPVDYLYTRDRARPDLVVPVGTTSAATPFVAAAAALLAGVARDRPALARDPVTRGTATRAAGRVTNAGRAEVIRAVLMAGASRRTPAGQAPGITDYRVSPVHRTANGLDRRFGAGQLDVDASLRILVAGEQDSQQDAGAGSATVARLGFDYDPAFGGAGGSNAGARYALPALAVRGQLVATLAWHLEVAGPTATGFDGAARLYNLELRVIDVTVPTAPRVLAESAGNRDNTESAWLPVPAGRRLVLEVAAGPGEGPFRWDYALAWRLDPATAAR
jgi:hypothetical protein